MSPRVIVLEGPDGCGKTAHADLLADALRASGISARSFHHAKPPRGASAYEAALHFAAERAGLLRRTQCDVVVADRWHTSTSVLATAMRHMGADASTVRAMRLTSEAEDSGFTLAGAAITEVFLDAPDAVLDARLLARGTPATEMDRAIRAAYRRISGPRLLTEGPREEVAAQLTAAVLIALRDRCGFRRAVQVIRGAVSR